jgi:hypothetical protein
VQFKIGPESFLCVCARALQKRKLAPIVSGKHDLIHLPRSHCFVHQCGREGGKNKGNFHVCVGCERASHTLRRIKKRYTTNRINPIKRVANNERISLCAGARIGREENIIPGTLYISERVREHLFIFPTTHAEYSQLTKCSD